MQKILGLKDRGSLAIDPKKIDEEINKLVLLSKDVENISACINKSKQFFDTISVKLQINRRDFITIDRNMTLEEIATALKSNELNLFNQILFKSNKGESLMYTAQ
jgi:regulatory protein YycH of two-component signal transduction system YycFG